MVTCLSLVGDGQSFRNPVREGMPTILELSDFGPDFCFTHDLYKQKGDLRCSCTFATSSGILLSVTEVSVMTKPKDLVQGTLDLLILRIVALEPMHGWAIAHRIRQMSSDVLQVGQSALYPALHKLEQQGWIKAEWKISETNRRAKYYSLTRAGRKALTEEAANWERLSAAISAVVRTV